MALRGDVDTRPVLRPPSAGAAFGPFAGHLGGGEPIATATTPYKAHVEVFHDAEHPSAILLPTKE